MKLKILVGLSLLLVSLLVLYPAAAVLAQEEEAPPEVVTLTATFTKLEGVYGTSFEFEVSLEYTGATEPKTFDLTVSGPRLGYLYHPHLPHRQAYTEYRAGAAAAL